MRNSRSILLAALLVAFLASPGLAQVGLSVGPRIGIGFANVGGDLEDTDSNFGLSFGGSFGLQLHDYFRLGIDGQWVQKGFSQEEVVDIDGLEQVDASFNGNYIEFMVPATMTIPIPESPITPRLYVGPALAIEVSCGISGEALGVEVELDCDEAGAETKSIDFSIFFGGGVDLAVGTGAITVDLFYDLGLTDLNDVTGDPTSIKNRNIQILAGYRFFFGG